MLLLDVRQRVVEQRSLTVVVVEFRSQHSVLNAADRCLVVGVCSLLRSVLRGRVLSIGEVRGTVLIDVSPVLTVSMVEGERTSRLVDGDLVVVDTETRDLRVLVREVSPGEQRVVGEIDTRYDLAAKDEGSTPRKGKRGIPTDMRSAECHLLGFYLVIRDKRRIHLERQGRTYQQSSCRCSCSIPGYRCIELG